MEIDKILPFEKTKCNECETSKIYTGGLCKSCFKKTNEVAICIKCNECGIYARGLCKRCYSKERYKNNKERIIINETCSTLKKHSEDMKNDSDSLSTEFIMNLIDTEYDELEDDINDDAIDIEV